MTRTPVEALQLIGQDHARYRQSRGYRHLEWIALGLIRYGADKKQAYARVIGCGRQDECRPPPLLFVTSLRIESEPDEIASVRYVRQLPDLATFGRARENLGVEVTFPNTGEQLFK
jgi:hypothetical protein